MTLKFYDHLDTVDLDTTNAKIEKGGWPQNGPTPLPGNKWAEVEESIRVAWLLEDDDDRAAEMGKLGKLAIRALEVQNPLHPYYDDPAKHVVMEAKTPTETNTRYATISMIRSPQLDTRHQGGQQWLTLSAKVMREGLWRGVRPGGTMINLVNAQQVYNHDYSTKHNYITVDPDDIDGDAPGILKLTFKTVSGQTSFFANATFFVSVVTADSLADLNAMELWQLANSATSINAGGTPVDATAAGFGETPDTYAIKWTQQTAGNAYYELANALAKTSGAFQVYVVGQPDEEDKTDARFLHGFGSSPQSGPGVDAHYGTDAGANTWRCKYLGEIQVPPGGLVRGQSSNKTYTFRHQWQADDAVDYYQAAGFLMPTHEQFFGAKIPGAAFGGATGLTSLVIDGEIERVYSLDDNGDLLYSSFPLNGQFPQIVPGKWNRIYFYNLNFNDPSGGTGPHYFFSQFHMTADYVPRYQYLRGAG